MGNAAWPSPLYRGATILDTNGFYRQKKLLIAKPRARLRPSRGCARPRRWGNLHRGPSYSRTGTAIAAYVGTWPTRHTCLLPGGQLQGPRYLQTKDLLIGHPAQRTGANGRAPRLRISFPKCRASRRKVEDCRCHLGGPRNHTALVDFGATRLPPAAVGPTRPKVAASGPACPETGGPDVRHAARTSQHTHG